MAQVQIKNINLGGIADSDFLGAENSVAEAIGLDIHSESGVIKVNQKLTKESGSTVDDLVKATVPSSDGNAYFFGSTNGKIWKRTSGGVWSLEATATPAAGSAGIKGAAEYQGYIYYAMQNRLGRWQLGTAWSTRNDNWATFTNGDADFHPMKEVNLVLYIGDANLVAQVEAGVFTANALDIITPLRIKCLGRASTDLLIGTFVNNNVNQTEIFRWNTWSPSFTSSDPIPEVGINAFLDADNYIIVNAGTKGNLYLYDGNNLDLYKQIKGSWDSTKKAVVHSGAVFNFHNLPLFGLSQQSGDPAKLGIYSLARTNRNYPFVLNLEFIISSGNMANIEIGAIVGAGDVFLVAWKDTTSGTVYGVDVLDLTAKYSGAYFITRVITLAREKLLNYGVVNVPYRLKPTNTDIKIHSKINNGSMAEITDRLDDTGRQLVETKVDINEASKIQVKIEMTASANTAPEIESAIIDINT